MAYDPPSPPSGPIDPSRIGRLSTPLTGEALERRRRLAAFDDALADYDRSFPGAGDPPPPPETPATSKKRRPLRWWLRWAIRGLGVFIVLLILAIGWLALTAPLSKSLEPPAPPSITLLSSEGTPIAERGANIGKPVDATKLPAHVTEAFMAIEDRRFRTHWGIDPRGIARAMWTNTAAGGVRQGASTITQQLAKNAFLDSDRTAARKIREVLIAFWLEAWLTKDEIMSRYLSNAYFGDNAYGLDAAARHYFSRAPKDLTVGQAAMLAGLVKAPSRLAPTGNLKGARARQAVVVGAMEAAGYLTAAEADRVKPAVLRVTDNSTLPSGTYFADWVLPQARDRAGGIGADRKVTTTLEIRMQRAAERAVRNAGLKQTQVAIVAMRPDGRVIAMVGGKNYAASPFNRAVQARRQPGSTFKLFVYLAAMRSGLNPQSQVLDEPVTIGDWSPKNSDGRYLGTITLERAFQRSSNVAAARLTKEVGVKNVIRAARDLGISTPIANEASIALGTSTVSLLELTSAYAAIAAGEAPVIPRGLAEQDEPTWLDRLRSTRRALSRDELDGMRTLLAASIRSGTGIAANLPVEAFGKTGTTQDNRDALFVGYAGGIVAGVWLGNDDNSTNPGLAGGGLPARIWRDFMRQALNLRDPVPVAAPEPEPIDNAIDAVQDALGIPDEGPMTVEGPGFDVSLDRDGQVRFGPNDRRRREEEPVPQEERRPPEEDVQ
ncbi:MULTISPECIES: transglycosylase domain-containing protein [unclassified Sphingomonas]|uniref:transglycosylase domain-containing protein n=1 Tax=unclassified Sphingomonas TaxID=196159 RepID=UPI0006F754AB|nr:MULTISPECIES: transglycosylase domain-containing protein [unclassified Sphingomonas]KQM58928.1 penicillin-binding protein [Sphingomonas sp. Leaf16]KQN11183.1 penicillin-binding protein [Sphingomonas sp. Leaf29]KQN18481.1 penicillin-binding protein [Sphingomonas sp. Leaf32]